MAYLEYQTVVPLDTEYESGFTIIDGQIFGYAADDSRVKIGELTAFYLDVERWRVKGEQVWELFDLHDDLPVYYDALFDAREFIFDYETAHLNILIINNMQIQPYFRGLKIGLAAIYQTMETWGHGCSIVTLKPFPLQLTYSGQQQPDWFAAMDMRRYPADPVAAVTKLKVYYAQLGFVDLGATEVMYLNRDLILP